MMANPKFVAASNCRAVIFGVAISAAPGVLAGSLGKFRLPMLHPEAGRAPKIHGPNMFHI